MTKKLWGGRFKKEVNKDFFEFQKSISNDYKLAEYDIYHSLIHINALKKVGVLDENEANDLGKALYEILEEVKSGGFKPDAEAEDIHTQIQNKLELNTEAALKLQSYRSRNEQIVFDEKNYCFFEGINISGLIVKMIVSLTEIEKLYDKDWFIVYTHTQRAQVIRFSEYILSFFWMLIRDGQRIFNFLDNLKIEIGSGAAAGSNYIKKIHYDKAVEEFIKEMFKDVEKLNISLTKNPLDNVSDRDFMIEFLNILSILQMHLSRLAEDFILYSSKEFDFLELPEEFCTGSSLLPQKKNPDFLELVRGYTGRIYGNLISVLTTMKGLPSTYNKDMQVNKESLFSSVDIIKNELIIFAKFLKNIKLKSTLIKKKVLEDESLYATELAEYLIEKKIPFKEAHEIVGKLIRYGEQHKIKIKEMSTRELKTFSSFFNKAKMKQILSPSFAISKKRVISDEVLKEAINKTLESQKDFSVNINEGSK